MSFRKKIQTNGIFFWRTKKSMAQKAEEMMAIFVKMAPEIKKIMRADRDELGNPISDGKRAGIMYDYYQNAEEHTREVAPWTDLPMSVPNDDRVDKKPVEVMEELERVPTPFNIDNLDEKIESLKDKSKLSNQRFAKEQIIGLIKRLENRKKYKDNVDFYTSFPYTTDEKIDLLLSKYKLVMQTSDLFIPSFPKEAIDIMKKYNAVTEEITGETPVYYVIAEEKDFKEKRKKLDPILLVQSPFGFYWQILGAWDKEMLLLSEL